MSGIHAGDRGDDTEGAVKGSLQSLASVAPAAGPYGFDEFEQRGARRAARRRAVHRGLVASFATVGVAVFAAITLQQLRPAGGSAPQLVYATPYLPVGEPAVVDVGRLAMREALSDRIALLDLQLTEGRAYALPEEQLASLAAARDQLEQSLRSVSYAHALMTY